MVLTVGIFAGASDNVEQHYLDLAYQVGKLIGEKGHRFIWGAGSTGLMGACVRGYVDTKPRLKPFGSTTRFIEPVEPVLEGAHIITCVDFDDREELYHLCDIIVALPGGEGTRAEIYAFVVQQKFSLWEGEIWLLNEYTHYDYFLKDLDLIKKEQFVSEKDHKSIRPITFKELTNYLE